VVEEQIRYKVLPTLASTLPNFPSVAWGVLFHCLHTFLFSIDKYATV